VTPIRAGSAALSGSGRTHLDRSSRAHFSFFPIVWPVISPHLSASLRRLSLSLSLSLSHVPGRRTSLSSLSVLQGRRKEEANLGHPQWCVGLCCSLYKGEFFSM